jgi:polyketide synthase Type III
MATLHITQNPGEGSCRLVTVLPSPRPRIVCVGTARPPWRYTQEEIASFLGVPEGLGRRFFRTSGVETRNLYLQPAPDGTLAQEDEYQLLERHRRGALELGREAVSRCLAEVSCKTSDIQFLCCVTSSGFMLPGLSAMYVRHLGFRDDCQRLDIVGMGCNAALNAMNAATNWAAVNPGRLAMIICCEVNSAIHVQDDRLVTALANCLFGDGCAAVLITTAAQSGAEVLGFSSQILPDVWRAISYHWSREHGKFELYLDKDIPRVLGLNSPVPVSALLDKFALRRNEISHWLVHAGGRKVITAVGEANGLNEGDVRHSKSVLRELGNLGSATVLFSYQELMAEGCVSPGDYGVMIAMGPGVAIETALLSW